jgi:hypothetical protein
MQDASDFYVVPVFGGFGIPVSTNPYKTTGQGFLTFKDAYGTCSTTTYVRKYQ